MANTGLKTPMQVTRPNWTAMTSASPAGPGAMNASPIDQHARSVPAMSMHPVPPEAGDEPAGQP